jgi:aspartyl-tRNA(Asn)/glutamyl-tRNA(Gln) amidotransferase subunit A
VIEGREIAAMSGSLQMLIMTVAPEAWQELEPHLIGGVDAVPAGLVEILTAGREQGAAEYIAAQRDRIALRRAVDEALADVDALAMPTSLGVAWRWADIEASDMGLRKEATRNLPIANLTGHPAISIPVPSDSLPVGLQLIGRMGQDERLLDLARWVEQSLRQ